MSVIYILSRPRFDEEVSKEGPYVIYYTASWCSDCISISPYVSRQAEKYPSIRYLKVDVEKIPLHPRQITEVPRFEFYANGSLVTEFIGNNQKLLEEGSHKLFNK